MTERRWRSWDTLARMAGPWHLRGDRRDGSEASSWRTEAGEPGLGDHRLEDLVNLTDAAAAIIRERWAPTFLVVATGEATADAVAAAGFPGVGTVCGASSTPGPAVIALLSGWSIVLAPDNDDVGRAHMDRIGRALEPAGVPRLSIVRPPDDAPAGWDLADAGSADVVALVSAAWLRPISEAEVPRPIPRGTGRGKRLAIA